MEESELEDEGVLWSSSLRSLPGGGVATDDASLLVSSVRFDAPVIL